MTDVFIAIFEIAAVLAISLYATWLLVSRLKRGESKPLSFREWIKHILEAIWGL